MDTVASFDVKYAQFLDADGHLVGSPPRELTDPELILPMYRHMTLTRVFDTKAIALQRTGQLGTYGSCFGQEAIGAAVGSAMRNEDVLLPTYREQGAQLARGVSMSELLLYWGGDERGSNFEGPKEDFPICIPIGTQCCHAVGVACAFKLRQQPRVAVCMAGDGATSRGDVYESMNVAGVWRLPTVFVISNNQWAISVPRSAQTAAETIAQKAIGAGFEGVQVDGNDVIALRWALDRALDKARSGQGPTLVEAITYRLQDHTTADSASRYRPAEEVERWRALEPISRTRSYLKRQGAWSDEDDRKLDEECAQAVQQSVDVYLTAQAEDPEAMFDSLYATLPVALAWQREAAVKDERGHG
ncbi:MAG: pyruvate dehydrogenase (acetyl-transferring) E1 component subunit alpha [Gammaproteobacteria bacterium]